MTPAVAKKPNHKVSVQKAEMRATSSAEIPHEE